MPRALTLVGIAWMAVTAASCAAWHTGQVRPHDRTFTGTLVEGRDWDDCRAEDLGLTPVAGDRFENEGAWLHLRMTTPGEKDEGWPGDYLPLRLHLTVPEGRREAAPEVIDHAGASHGVSARVYGNGFEDFVALALDGLPPGRLHLARLEFDLEVRRVVEEEVVRGTVVDAGDDIGIAGFVVSGNDHRFTVDDGREVVTLSTTRGSMPLPEFFEKDWPWDHVVLFDGMGRILREGATASLIAQHTDYGLDAREGEPGLRYPVTVLVRRPIRWETCRVRFVVEGLEVGAWDGVPRW